MFNLVDLKTILKRYFIIKEIIRIKALMKLDLHIVFEKLRYKKKHRFNFDVKAENLKYSLVKKEMPNSIYIRKQQLAFYSFEPELCINNLVFTENLYDPILVVPVKNELNRMKLLYKHYRALGVTQFVVIDNDSTDGTFEWCCQQVGTRVYRIKQPYQTERRNAWIERVLALVGYDKWYIVVDSDELLDYVGSEIHPITELIKVAADNNYSRIVGYQVDMYNEHKLFSGGYKYEEIPSEYCWFDTDSYSLKNTVVNRRGSIIDLIIGGPRNRLFEIEIQLSKQSIFYFTQKTIYCNSHYLSPLFRFEDLPCYCVIRHYKFLENDKDEYLDRINKKNFAANSSLYKKQMSMINANPEGSFIYEGSAKYCNSYSFRCLPYIEEIPWEE